MANDYAGLSRHYGLIMTSGYYDYGAFARALLSQLAGREKALELGVGTGLACERLRELGGTDMKITGIDHTETMLTQARARLGDSVRLARKDIVESTTASSLGSEFDAAYSIGGVWYCTRHEGEGSVSLCSHLLAEDDDARALKNVAATLRPGALLLIGVQQAHRDYERPLPNGLMYAQEIRELGEGQFIKDHFVRQGDEVVARQRCTFRVCARERGDRLLEQCGFRFRNMTNDGLLRTYIRA